MGRLRLAGRWACHHLPERTYGKTIHGRVARDLATEHTDCPCRWYVLTPDGLALAAEHGVTHTTTALQTTRAQVAWFVDLGWPAGVIASRRASAQN
jgi:hypothetical protein